MKKCDESIFQIINHKNKKCKKPQKTCNNSTNALKTGYYNISTTNVYGKMNKVCGYKVNLFPQWQIHNNKQQLIDISKIIAEKINNNIEVYRGQKGKTFVELVAIDCTRAIIKSSQLTAESYINTRYGFCNFYKKELKVLPYLIINCLLSYIASTASNLQRMQKNIIKGARAFSVSGIDNWQYAKIYGFAKYNKNTLKISTISAKKLKNCVFYFIVGLNKTNMLLNNAIGNVIKLQKRYL